MGRKPPKPDNFDFPKYPLWVFGEIPLSRYPRVPLVDAMNFSSWPDENRPTELRRPWEEALALLFLSFPLSIKPGNGLLFTLIPRLSKLKFKLDLWPTSCHMSTLVRVRLRPEAIYFISVQVQVISHELDSSHSQFLRFS